MAIKIEPGYFAQCDGCETQLRPNQIIPHWKNRISVAHALVKNGWKWVYAFGALRLVCPTCYNKIKKGLFKPEDLSPQK